MYTALRDTTSDAFDAERAVLALAQIVDVAAAFSRDERAWAEVIASRDRRLRVALDEPEFGITQVLAAAPELVRRWTNAADPYGQAVITAVLDARRIGVESPLSVGTLGAAAPGYLSATQRVTAPPDWLQRALSYATAPLLGAATALTPVPAAIGSAAMGQMAGYGIADYLLQHGAKVLRTARIPASAWEAFTERVDDPDDLHRLAFQAKIRGLYRYAERAYRRAAAGGDKWNCRSLAEFLAERG